MANYHLIVVPGLSGDSYLFSKIVNSWKKFGFIPHVHDVDWKEGGVLQKIAKRFMSQSSFAKTT